MSRLGRPSATLPLPHELIDKIISELAEREYLALAREAEESLKNCSLVNSVFRACSQPHLFWHLNLRDDAVVFDRASELLSGSERIRSMVRSLYFCDWDSCITGIERCQVLLQCTKINRLFIKSLGEGNDARWPPTKKEFYANLFSLPKLSKVSIKREDLPIQLLAYCKGLKSLAFHGCVCNYASQSIEQPNNAKVELQTLDLLKQRDLLRFLTWISDPETSPIDIRGLQSLRMSLFYFSDNKKDALRAFIHRCKALRFLSITDGEFPALLPLNLRHLEHLRRIKMEIIYRADEIPSFIRWLGSSTSGLTSIVINQGIPETGEGAPEVLQPHQDCYTGSSSPWSQKWREIDDAFQESQLTSVEELQLNAAWHGKGKPHDHAQCIRNHTPYLSSQPYFELVMKYQVW